MRPKQENVRTTKTLLRPYFITSLSLFFVFFYDVSSSCQPLINSRHHACGLVAAEQSTSHLPTPAVGVLSLLQPNYFTLRALEVAHGDGGVPVIHSLMMSYAAVLPKLTL